MNNVTGWAGHGEILGIMGSSGAGKSTLMNVLAKRNLKNVKGTKTPTNLFVQNLKKRIS